MFAVHFFENKNALLTQLLKQAPSVGEDLKIKGRKAKVTAVKNIDDKNIHVQVTLEILKQKQPVVDPKKKKK
ncbi:hypothetical protein [Neobacillus niacini]|uniref:hypothetical protein n=1 Tax=Neobacillus niacini TaxID=86668 RepID=UPI0021CB24DB|nr:hypothetical protein [Neobacillus niacini]MCM3767679.1 hypothetical protein [Neobacillus niacini]